MLPPDVLLLREWIKRGAPEKDYTTAPKLLEDTKELAAMWKAVEKRKPPGEDPQLIWVRAFLARTENAAAFTPHQALSRQERNALSAKIAHHAKRLAHALEQFGLDGHVVHVDGSIFNGFYFYEGFSEKNQASIDEAGTPKLKISLAIRGAANRAVELISADESVSKGGRNSKAIRFIRSLAQQNERVYGRPLLQVIATAANALYDTNYAESDVRKALVRHRGGPTKGWAIQG